MNNYLKAGLLLSAPSLLLSYSMFVKEDTNVRIDPSLQSEIVEIYSKNKQVDVEQKVYTSNDGTWYKTKDGYVSIDLLSDKKLDTHVKNTAKRTINHTFKDQFMNAQDEAYSITLLYSYPSVVDEFVENNLANNSEYLVFERERFTRVMYGVYENIEEARKALKNLDPHMTKNAYTTKLSTFRYKQKIKNGLVKKEIAKDVYINEEIFEAYTLVPTELLTKEKIRVEKSQKKIKKEPNKIHGNFEYARFFTHDNEKKQKPSKNDTNKYFISAGLNYNILSTDINNESGSIEINSLDDSSFGYKINIGTYLYEKYALALEYKKFDFDEIDIQQYGLRADYLFTNKYNSFVGIAFGKVEQKWTSDPLNNSASKDIKASSEYYGIQAGIRYLLTKNLYFIPEISYNQFDLETDLTSGTAKSSIENKNNLSLDFGLRYEY